MEVYAPNSPFELQLNGRVVATGQTSDCYALVDVPYEPGTLEVHTPGDVSCVLATVDATTVHLTTDDVKQGEWLISRLWLEDANGMRALDCGKEIDVTREGWQLVAAGSEGTSTEGAFGSPRVRLMGQGALAIYKRA